MPAHMFVSHQHGILDKNPSWNLKVTESQKCLLEDDSSIFSSVVEGSLMSADARQEDGSIFSSSLSSSCSSYCNFDTPRPSINSSSEAVSSRKKRKGVRFAPRVKVDYFEKATVKERKKLWLSHLEMLLLQKYCLYTLSCLSDDRLMAALKSESASDRFTARGLEGHTHSQMLLRAERKRQSQDAVFYEQWSQLHGQHTKSTAAKKLCGEGCPGHRRSPARVSYDRIVPLASSLDQEAIAEQYAMATYESQQEATLQGFKDEQDVKVQMHGYSCPSFW